MSGEKETTPTGNAGASMPVTVEAADGTRTTMQYSMADIMAALRAQGGAKKEMKGQPEETPPCDSDKKNSKFILCTQCHCKILKPGKSTLVQKKIYMHHMALRGGEKKQGGDDLTAFWLVTDQFHFENIGVSKTVSDKFRYLACSDCEKGPVGIRFTDDPGKFYIAHKRVNYASAPAPKKKE